MNLKFLVFGAVLMLIPACTGGSGSNVSIPPEASFVTDTSSTPLQSSTARDIIATAAVLNGTGGRDAGKASGDVRLALSLTLKYRNQADLDELVMEQHRSSSYRRWLTNEEFNARFAPSQADYDRVVKSLRLAGFRVTQTFENRTVVDADGTVGQVERYFHTVMHRVVQGKYGNRYVNVLPADAPSELHGLLLSVDGLDTLSVIHMPLAFLPRGAGAYLRHDATSASKLYGPLSSKTQGRGYGPLAFWGAYDLPVGHAASKGRRYDGSGRATAVVIDADVEETDINGYLKYFKIKRTGPPTKRILVDGGPPAGDSGNDSIEAGLDSETVVSNAPGTALYLYEMPGNTLVYPLQAGNITDAYNKVVADNKVDVVSSSFGACEALVSKNTAEAWDKIAEQGLAKGMTFVASSGDQGGNLCTIVPAASPNFVAAGGTALSVGPNGGWFSEVGWAGSGGGVSTVFPVPAWQRGVAGVNPLGRNVPDVSLNSDPYTGISFFYESSWDTLYNPLGGTSFAAPLYAAAATAIDQVKNARVGLTSQKLFTLWKAHGYGNGQTAYFHDVVQGGNGAFYAEPGYDLATGIGSIDVWNLAGLL